MDVDVAEYGYATVEGRGLKGIKKRKYKNEYRVWCRERKHMDMKGVEIMDVEIMGEV